MEHPPIPPNCPYFRDSDGWHLLILISAGEERWFDLSDMNGPLAIIWRPVIAAVARCAWLDVHEEARNNNWACEWTHNERGELISKYQVNTESWRVWGLKQ